MSQKIHRISGATRLPNKQIKLEMKGGEDSIVPDTTEGMTILGSSTLTSLTVGGSILASLSGFGSYPVGSILPTLPHLSGAYNCTATIVADSQGFVQCNGQTIVDGTSPMNGVTVPNINNNVFLAGHTTSGSIGGQNSFTITTAMLPPHTHTIDHSHTGITTGAASTPSTADASPATSGASSSASTGSASPATSAGASCTTTGSNSVSHTHPASIPVVNAPHSHTYNAQAYRSILGYNASDALISRCCSTCTGTTSCFGGSFDSCHTHSWGTSGTISANHQHCMPHTHTIPTHTHDMPHTHTMPHTHSMPHVHPLSIASGALNVGPGLFANNTANNMPSYITAKYIIRIK